MRTIWVGHVVCTGDNYTRKFSCETSREERPLKKPWSRWKDETDIEETGYEVIHRLESSASREGSLRVGGIS
jgi:hypothetical protein